MKHGLLLLLLGFSVAAAAARDVQFAKGAASIAPPAGYTHALEDEGQTLVLRPPQKGLFEIRFTFNAVPVRADHPQLAREFVIDAARQKNKPVVQFKGSRSIGFIERGPGTVADGEPVRNLHGLLTLGQGYVTLTLSVPEKHVERPEVREFVNQGIEALIATLKAGK